MDKFKNTKLKFDLVNAEDGNIVATPEDKLTPRFLKKLLGVSKYLFIIINIILKISFRLLRALIASDRAEIINSVKNPMK